MRTSGLIKIIILIFLIGSPALLKAQPSDNGDDVLDNPVPFDGGVSLLVAAGVGYGLKKAHEKKKKDKITDIGDI